MKCANCGSEIESGLVYCPKCGTAIQLVPNYNVLEEELLSKIVEDKDAAGKDRFATGVYQPVVTHEDETIEETNEVPTKKAFWNKKTIIIISSTVAIVLCIIIGALIYNLTHSYDYNINKAKEYEENASYTNAIIYYSKANDMSSKTTEAIYGLGRCYFEIGDYKTAKEYLLKSLEEDGDNPDIYLYLVRCYSKLDETEKILDLYDSTENEEIKQAISAYITLPPEFSLDDGEYDMATCVYIYSKDDYPIYYTTNGKDPRTAGKLYTEQIQLTSGSYLIKACCLSEEGKYSDVIEKAYVINVTKPETPTVSPEAGNCLFPTFITITVPEGCTCYYTLDGTNPTEASTPYTEPFMLAFGSSRLKVIAIDENGNMSDIYSGTFICTAQ